MNRGVDERTPLVFIGVDVGTGSARAGVFDARGNILASAKQDIEIHREPGDIVEQSSADIWQAVCADDRSDHLCRAWLRSCIDHPGPDRYRIPGRAHRGAACHSATAG